MSDTDAATITTASTAATIQSVPQMGRPSEMPRYVNRFPWYRVASESGRPVVSWKNACISSTLPMPRVTTYAPIVTSSSPSPMPAGEPAALIATEEYVATA